MGPEHADAAATGPDRGSPAPAAPTRTQALERVEAELMDKLAHCVPPVDQHRRALERVRSELADLRRGRERG